MIYSEEEGHTLGVNYHFFGINEHFGGPSVHCIVDKSSKIILARGRAPPPTPLSGNARVLGAYGPQTHPLQI